MAGGGVCSFYLGGNTMISQAIAFDSHNYHTHQTIQSPCTLHLSTHLCNHYFCVLFFDLSANSWAEHDKWAKHVLMPFFMTRCFVLFVRQLWKWTHYKISMSTIHLPQTVLVLNPCLKLMAVNNNIYIVLKGCSVVQNMSKVWLQFLASPLDVLTQLQLAHDIFSRAGV